MGISVYRLLSFGLEVNRSEKSSKGACVKLFNQAEDSIVIVSGELNGEFYGDSGICRALTDASKRGVSLEVAYGPQASNQILTALQDLRKKYSNVKLYPLSERPERHFMLIDGKTVRVQLGHLSGNKEHRAIIKHNSPEVAATYSRFYESIIEEGEPNLK